jgi:exosome complex component RRP43
MAGEGSASGTANLGVSPSQLAQSFPAPLFAVLDPPAYLNAHLSTPTKTLLSGTGRRIGHAEDGHPALLRPSGRQVGESAQPSIHAKAPLANTAGSAVLRVGDASVVAGVRIELLDVRDCPDLPAEFLEEERLLGQQELGDGESVESNPITSLVDSGKLSRHVNLLVPNVELATGSSPQLLPGSAPTTLAQSTASQLHGLMHSLPVLTDSSQLVIRNNSGKSKGKTIGFWVLYIDITVLSIAAHSSASLLSAILPCVLAALKGVTLPSVRFDENIDGLVCDSRKDRFSALKVNERYPTVVAFGVFEPALHKGLVSPLESNESKKRYILADVDSLEGELCSEEIMVIVEGDTGKKKTRLRKVVKMGGSAAALEDMNGVIRQAEARWSVWNELLSNLDTMP